MKRSMIAVTLLVALAAACTAGPAASAPAPAASLAASTTAAPTSAPNATATQPVSQKRCGDNVCDGPENSVNCPTDCGAATSAAATGPATSTSSGTVSIEAGAQPNTYWVTHPTSGARLYVEVLHPSNWNGPALPTLVLVPGGNGSSEDFKGPKKSAQELADAGYTVIIFDADGRGQSEGSEDQNGFIHQDGLAAIIRAAGNLPGVDAAQMGLGSFSYGITMASGVLARYPDLPIRFLIDWEGPADRTDTGGCDASRTGHLKGVVSCDDEAYWAEREALTFIAQIRVPYQRIQTERDHAQPDVTHTVKMVNAAVQGGAPWVRLDDDEPNQTYALASPPEMLPESVDRDLMALYARYAQELLALP